MTDVVLIEMRRARRQADWVGGWLAVGKKENRKWKMVGWLESPLPGRCVCI